MTALSYRTRELAPDWRREPKTSCFCGLCQRDMTAGAAKFWVGFELDCFPVVIHPADIEIAAAEILPRRQSVPQRAAIEFEAIGVECASKIGADWLFDTAAHDAALAMLKTRDTKQ